MRAFAWRGGVIEFGARVPDGAIQLLRGRDREVRRTIEARARHGYDGLTLLVPGVPEADGDDDALDAVIRFRDWIGGGK